MATLTLGTAGNYTWYLDYTLTQSVPNNQSTVAYTLRIRRNVSAANGAWWGTPARNFTVNIGGSTDTEAFASVDFRNAQDINFTSGSFTWTHNADGTMAAKSVTGSVSGSSVSAGFPVPTSVGSPTISFPTIPRAATSISRSGSTSTGSASTLTISPLVSSFYYVLQYKSPATAAWTTIGPAGGIAGSSWPYSHTVPHAEIPNAGSGTIQYQVTTKQTSGGTTIGSPVSASFTYTVPSTVLPVVTAPTWAEGATTGAALTTLTNSNEVFVQGWSRLKPTFSSTPGTGATLSSGLATVNGHSGSVSSGGTFAAPITTQGSSATFSVKATDSRGRTDTETGTVSPAVHRWSLPVATAGSPVVTPTSTTQTIALSGLSATTTSFYLSAAQRNVLETRTGYRDLTTAGAWVYGSWTTRPVSASDATDNAYAPGTPLTVATGLDPTHEYQVAFQVRDIFGKNGVNYSNGLPYVESVVVVPAQGVLVAYEGNTRVGIRKIPTLGVLDVGGDIYQNGNLVADVSMVASTTARGLVELATTTEAAAGTATTLAVTPQGVEAWGNARTASDTERGLIEIATAAEVAARSDVTRAVTPGRMNDHPGIPFAMAAGAVAFTHSGTATVGISITLPAGRFSQPPLATVNLTTGAGGSQKDMPRIYGTTTTALTAGIWTADGTSAASHNTGIGWIAVQMTSAAAAG